MLDRTEADVVIAGGGILGICAAYHLLDSGARRVVVVEADTPGAATSGAGAGFVGLWAAGYADFFADAGLELEQYGIDFYRRLAAEDPSIECRSNGNLFLGTTEEGCRLWIDTILQHPLAPAAVRALTAPEVTEITGGVIAADTVLRGALHPGGIQVSAGRATRALARRVAARGAEVRARTRLTGLITAGGRVEGVQTEGGDIYARTVVLACGAWCNEVLAETGYRAPLLRMIATRVISRPSGVSGSMPTVMVPDLFGLWLREHRGGLTWGNGDGYSPLFELGGSLGADGQPRREELVERLDVALTPKLRKLVPAHDTSIGWWLQGVPCMTPDRRFLAGPVPGVNGLYLLAGDNEAGVTHGPGLGRLLAEVILTGGSQWLDPAPYRPDRFQPAQFPTDESVLAAMPSRR
ncbi:MAG TPA: FAD-binding oxidoreductase [Streptosporangiaceae bacterium]|jgi:sarcosine oxidase subunit beta|nr:FAD-binding oxidoreductase [Streptosporangiaceae bacterium]